MTQASGDLRKSLSTAISEFQSDGHTWNALAEELGMQRTTLQDAVRSNRFSAESLPRIARLLGKSNAELEAQYAYKLRRQKKTKRQRVREMAEGTDVVDAIKVADDRVQRAFRDISELIDPVALFRFLTRGSLFIFYSSTLLPLEAMDAKLKRAVAEAILKGAYLVYYFPSDSYVERMRRTYGLHGAESLACRQERMDNYRKSVWFYAKEHAEETGVPFNLSLEDVLRQMPIFQIEDCPFNMMDTTIGYFRHQSGNIARRRVTMRLPISGNSSPIIPLPNQADPQRDFGHQIERFAWMHWGGVLSAKKCDSLTRNQALDLAALYELGDVTEWGLDTEPKTTRLLREIRDRKASLEHSPRTGAI